jgi:hypothetical protein
MNDQVKEDEMDRARSMNWGENERIYEYAYMNVVCGKSGRKETTRKTKTWVLG